MRKLRGRVVYAFLLLVTFVFWSAIARPVYADGADATIYVYACGSDLESRKGVVSDNIDELLACDLPEGVSVVIQTGGSKYWWNFSISTKHPQRFEVRNHKLVLLEELEDQSMGEASTLRDFLSWGAKRYWSERNVLVLIDHGGLSGDRLCFDYNWEEDALTRSELVEALSDAHLPAKYDLLAFDACFMANVENAVAIDDFADYALASQEEVPSVGLDYASILEGVATKDVRQLGKDVCDAFVQKCDDWGKADYAALSLLDLSQAQGFANAFDGYCADFSSSLENRQSAVSAISGSAHAAAVYVDSKTTNLIDVKCFVDAAHSVRACPSEQVLDAYGTFVAYHQGGEKVQSTGVSVYYPFTSSTKKRNAYMRSCPFEGYKTVLSRVFDSENEGGLTFADAGSVRKDGTFEVRLAEGCADSVASAYYTLKRYDESEKGYVRVGESYDVVRSEASGTYALEPHLTWPTMGGQQLCTNAFHSMPNVVVYTAPIKVEDSRATAYAIYEYREQYRDGSCTHVGTLKGLQPFDVACTGYRAFAGGDEVATIESYDVLGFWMRDRDAFVIPEGVEKNESSLIVDAPIGDGLYTCQLTFRDGHGRSVGSNVAMVEVKEGTPNVTEVRGSY